MSGSLRNKLLKDDRLNAVFEMIGAAGTAADIGCDHGYLAAALILGGKADTVIASDVSPVSAAKAAVLAKRLGISDRMKTACADGLDALAGTKPPYSIAICGMGGELIASILDRSKDTARAADLIVMQPMRGEAELRRYLFENGFGISDECIARDRGRYYQVIAAKPGLPNVIPDGFPSDQFRFGWEMAQKRDPLLPELLQRYRAAYARELARARAKGRDPEPIMKELAKTDALIRFINEDRKENPCS